MTHAMHLWRFARSAVAALVVAAAAAPAVTAAATLRPVDRTSGSFAAQATPSANYTSGVVSAIDRQSMTLNVDDYRYSAGGAVGMDGFADGHHVVVTFVVVNDKRVALTLVHSPDGAGMALAS